MDTTRINDQVHVWWFRQQPVAVAVAGRVEGAHIWPALSVADVAEVVRLATGLNIAEQVNEVLARQRDPAWLMFRVRAWGFLAKGEAKWRALHVDEGGDLRRMLECFDGVGCDADRSVRRSESLPFPPGTVAGGIPMIATESFEVVDTTGTKRRVPVGAGVWSCHAPGLFAVQMPDPPDVRELLCRGLLAEIGGVTVAELAARAEAAGGERVAVVKYLRATSEWVDAAARLRAPGRVLRDAADGIERGEHISEEDQ